jgi:GNAT superfamily N-acetyltransferase
MKKKEWGEITEYTPSMAVKMAEMFNAFSEIWPGGFGGGIPYDEQRVRDFLDSTSAIVDLVALDADGNPVGYCGLYPHYRDAHAAYISLLGVRPQVLGKKFGKHLLLRALEIAAEKGIHRVDLHTWSGNLKAMPLYKKVGLFWVPDTGVYMQDYIPGLLQIPLAREWFAAHPDWYKTFNRELQQAPDKTIVEGMELYCYTFESGEDRLSAEVDRYGWQVAGIERVLGGKRIAVKTRLHSHEILIGMPNSLTLELVNETGEDLSCPLQVEPFKGLKWTEPFPSSVSVKDGQHVKITRSFIVDSTAPVFTSIEMASDVIKTCLIVKGQPLELFTGGKIRPAVTITSQDPYMIAPPGKETRVYLDLMNNTREPLTGEVHISLEGCPDTRVVDFSVSPLEVSGIEIPVVTPDEGTTIIHAVPSITPSDVHLLMPEYTHTVVADTKDLAVVVKKSDQKELSIITDFVITTVERERGRVRISPRFFEYRGNIIDFEVGPPFGLSIDRSLTFDYEIYDDSRYLTVVLTADSIHVPGIRIKKYIRIAPGMYEVEYWVLLTNCDSRPLHVRGKVLTGLGEGLHINPFTFAARAFTPLKKGIIESDPSVHMMSESMVPYEPEHWDESWTSAESLNRSEFSGWMWNPDTIEKITVRTGLLHTLESETKVLPPGKTYEPIHMWYSFSHASLFDFRARWNQLVGHKTLLQRYPKIIPPVRVELEGPPVIERGKKSTKTLTIHFASPYPLTGDVQIFFPPGWDGHFVTEDGTNHKISMPESARGSVPIDVDITVPAKTPASAVVRLHFSGEFELDFDIPLLVVDPKEVGIQQTSIDGHTVYEVKNQLITFTVVTGAGGNLIRLTDSQKRSFFADNYPEIKPRLFVSYNIGGIQPLIFDPSQDNPFFEPEKTTTEIVTDGPWKGVKASWTVENQEVLRGQNFSLTYLTLPGSPVVRVVLEHENPKDRVVKWAGLLLADLQLQGSMDDTVLTAPAGTRTWVRNRVTKIFMSPANMNNPWVKASKGDQSVTFFVPEGSQGAVMVLDLVEMIAGLMVASAETRPHEKAVAEFALVVNYPDEKITELIKALARRQT